MKGVTVSLYVQTQTGTDAFGNPIYSEKVENVKDVLIGEPTTDDIANSIALYAKQLKCVLGIPKGDTHDWMDKKVTWTDAYGTLHTLHTYGYPVTGVEANIPTKWHMKVMCEQYG